MQIFGKQQGHESGDNDDKQAISSIEFNKEGSHLAYGNSEGIVSVVEIGQAEQSELTHARHICSKPYQSFLSHEPEFDCLKSQAIEEKISFIRWLPRSGPSHFLLSSNERTIKLWRLTEVPVQEFSNMNFPTQSGCRKKLVLRSPSDIRVPICSHEATNSVVRMYNKKVFSRGHGFSITDISPCADQEYFLSTDPLRIHLWSLDVHNEAFNIVDLMPEGIEDVTHLITGLACANQSPSLFAYCTNRGSVRLCDTRSHALCDRPAITFESLTPDEPNILTLLINSISSVNFGNTSDRFVFTRDYINVKVWDTQMPSCPVEVYPIQPHLRSHLSYLYEAELIFDDFKLAVSPNDRYIITGSYKDAVKIIDRQAGPSGTYHLRMQNEGPTNTVHTGYLGQFTFDSNSYEAADFDSPWPRRLLEDETKLSGQGALDGSLPDSDGASMFDDVGANTLFNPDVGRKWTQVTWSPKAPVVAACHIDGIHLLEAVV